MSQNSQNKTKDGNTLSDINGGKLYNNIQTITTVQAKLKGLRM